ncbi:MAG TPA: pirin family protein [Chakrabartia sp.]|jgi:redox-sensitive bicupin YhaK (pirin superfamily)|nr:pirin family protein [Chakrabartia sp.]
MIDVRPFAGLGHADHGWLDARHHFSFSSYHDPARMGWGALRVWNDDSIAAQTGFPPHPHADMEIVTYVRSGAISHKDSLGSDGRTVAGDVQVMSAGTGIRHSEYNLEDEATTLFQIWIMPDAPGGAPHWDQRAFPKEDRAGEWAVLASGNPEADDALPIRADARVLGATLPAGETLHYAAQADRYLYLVPATGRIRVNGVEANTRDGVAITGETALVIEALDTAELVLVDTR